MKALCACWGALGSFPYRDILPVAADDKEFKDGFWYLFLPLEIRDPDDKKCEKYFVGRQHDSKFEL